MKYFLMHEIMHALGLPHYSNSMDSFMYNTPTPWNNYRFKNVFRDMDSDQMFEMEKTALMKLFLEPEDTRLFQNVEIFKESFLMHQESIKLTSTVNLFLFDSC